MARSQLSCSPAYFHNRLTPKRNLTYPELVSSLFLDTVRPRHRRPLFMARLRRRVMGKVIGMIMSIGSIANTWSIESTKSGGAWSTRPTAKIASGWSIIFTKFTKNANTNVGIIKSTEHYDQLEGGTG
jgi:hypothetical protein